MIEFKCQYCGKFLKLPQSYAGRTTECPACLKTIQVPGSPVGGSPGQPPARVPNPSSPALQLCVDCGRSFPAGQMMRHEGQAVCTDCFYKRKPVKLVYRDKTKARRWKRLAWLGLAIVLLAMGGWLVWRLWFGS